MGTPSPALDAPSLNPGRVTGPDLTRIAALTQALKARIRALLDLRPGLRVLDVGCGPGPDIVAAAGRVGPDGLGVGIDYDADLISEAQRRHPRQAAAPAYVIADAAAIPHVDHAFDRTYSERVLQHCARPEQVVAEMVRVTRPGGLVLLADTDWATLSIDTPAVAAERALVRFVGDTLRNGYAGRQLRRLLLARRLVDVDVEVWPIAWTSYDSFRATSLAVLDMDGRAVRAGALAAVELAHLHATLADAEQAGTFFASAAIVIARGRTPRSWTTHS